MTFGEAQKAWDRAKQTLDNYPEDGHLPRLDQLLLESDAGNIDWGR